MTELMKKAIAKIDAEGEKGGSYGQEIAQFIIDALITDDDAARKILADEKSLAGRMKYQLEQARKSAEKNSSGTRVDDEVVFAWTCEYYGFAEETKNNLARFLAFIKKKARTSQCNGRNFAATEEETVVGWVREYYATVNGRTNNIISLDLADLL